MSIQSHHQRAIDRLVAAYADDPEFPALVIGGSVAKDCARPDSDVDFMIIATDDAFKRRLEARDLFINRRDLCDYEGGYVDGKIISVEYLRQVSEAGNEPSRAAFEDAFIAYSRVPELDGLIRQIHVYPEAGHDERLQSFYSMAFIQHWLMQEASRHNNRYTMVRAASQLALFSARLILAHNRHLFPYHKWLRRALEGVGDRPGNFIETFDALLERQDAASATALFDCIRNFRDWGVSDLDAYTWFMTEVEWSWMSDKTPMEDW